MTTASPGAGAHGGPLSRVLAWPGHVPHPQGVKSKTSL
eukprot:CAMPEP_0197901520 /NCGR_PEP_ID=MMETSP1439-20131203/51212_1 /TAXON_ID=66791 /ORGANISM="Gonyaulax spinifera, Strain CCMP409" /LENGTH=37 /DNA_ID= /DNA_START= /DNA_END= /DNA_ORIENTATION=